jgi:hypothetical protein
MTAPGTAVPEVLAGSPHGRSIADRVHALVRGSELDTAPEHWQGAFADESEAVLDGLREWSMTGPVEGFRARRIRQTLDACASRLDALRRVPLAAHPDHVAHAARDLARDLEMVLFLLDPGAATSGIS